MPKLSVLIPSRNEKYLFPTIRDCFAKRQGQTEVVVTLDGYWPEGWKEITEAYPDLHTVHHGEARGLRPAINSAAASAITRGADYLMKLDAHCLLDDGFDVKLLAEIEPNWIVVPRRKRLDPDAWTVTETHKPDIDYHYLSFPDDPKDFGGKGLNGKVWEERAKERRDKPEYEIDSEMSSQGSTWLLASRYFEELELMDSASYGPFWNEAQELFLKCWLSGGRGVVNKKTWYAHLHKGTKHGRGYRLPESWLKQGATFTKHWMYNEAWAKQTLPFSWLINHFWPVPSWPDNWEERLYAERRPRVVPVGAADNMGGDGVGVTAENPVVSGLQILGAYYGVGHAETEAIDVTARLQSLVKNGSLDVIVNNSTLVPSLNPFRGKKKTLWVTYSYDGGEPITVQRDEKDWLIIGQVQQREIKVSLPVPTPEFDRRHEEADRAIKETMPTINATLDLFQDATRQGMEIMTHGSYPRTATALNDYLIRKFSISPQRLRAPMPIELRDFHRNDLAQLFAELGFRRGAEIGVAEGNYSEVLCKANPSVELYCVDPWYSYPQNPQGKTNQRHEFAYNETKRKLEGYNADLIRKASIDAYRDFDSGTLDFVYVDGNHLFDFAMLDLILWSNKVRSGGIVSGDDYYQLDQKRWVGGGVVEAVNAYVNAHRIPVWFTFSGHKSYDYFWVRP